MKFKVGDRVTVYGSAGKHPYAGYSILYLRGDKGIIKTNDNDTLMVKLDGNGTEYKPPGHVVEVHPKQCRKLVPAKPRRKLWIAASEIGSLKVWVCNKEPVLIDGYVEFIEVRKGKKS